RSLSHLGRVHEALAIARNLAALPRHPKFNRLDKGDEIAGYARQRLLTICEEHMLWDEAVRLDEAGWLDRDGSVEADLSRVALLGRAQLRRGDLAAADVLIAELDSMLTRARAERAKKLDNAEDAALTAKKPRKDIDADLERAQREGTDLVSSVLDLREELKAERLLASGKHAEGIAALKNISGMPKILLADAHLAAGDPKAAIELLETEVTKSPGRLPTLGRLVLAYRQANDPAQAETLRAHESKLAEFPRARGPLAERLGLTAVADSNELFPADFGSRPPLGSLGPVNWQPQPAPSLALPATNGATIDLSSRRGKPTLVVFYLGFGCLHCIEQLQAIAPRAAAFRDQGIEILAIGTDEVEDAAESLDALDPAERFPFPLLADPKLDAFRAWRCHDDFEAMPLHGTFLVDGDGLVRWQDISFEPFTGIDWLLVESKRLLALPAKTQVADAVR
ncbi:MAG: redoxin domain-containing protein, partial [Planctomycetota bacterium]